MTTRAFVVGVVAGLMLCASEVSAQSGQPLSPQTPDTWQFEVVPYLWGSGIDGEVGIGGRTADVDASFRNILDHLHFAAMGLAEVRRDRVVAVADLIYTELRDHRATPGPLFSSVRPQQKLFILTSEAGYRILATDGGSVDVVGGIRFWHLGSELQFRAGLLPDLALSASRNWVDGIVGVRGKTALPRNLWVSAYGDVGAGGSDFTYQLVGIVGLDFREHYAVILGYRYLSVDYAHNTVLFDNALKGPLLGLTIKW